VPSPTNKSYQLLADSKSLDLLSKSAYLDCQIEVVPEVTSTQKVLLARPADALKPGTVLVTHFQSAGIGRLDRTWESAAGDSLMFSYVFKSRSQILPLFVGTAVAAALSKYLPIIKLKWPNDLVVEVAGALRKLGGIVMQRHIENPEIVVVGVGINLQFSKSRPTPEAIALDELIETLPDVNHLLVEILESFSRESHIEQSQVISAYEKRCLTLGREVEAQMLNAQSVFGKAVRINSDGGLVIETKDGEVEVTAGDIKHLR
jgi:BirA family biotin operon repressor/biotin-[acetyl-CoA-carboxylase] ligase